MIEAYVGVFVMPRIPIQCSAFALCSSTGYKTLRALERFLCIFFLFIYDALELQ